MNATTDIEAAILDDMARLRREIERAQEEEAAARMRRSEAVERLAERETALRVLRELLGIKQTPPPMPLFEEIPLGSIAEMCAAYMEQHGGSASVSELVAFLKERGKFTGKNQHAFYGTVFGTLRKHPRFRKAEGKGRFVLANPQDASNGAEAPRLESSVHLNGTTGE